MCVSSLRFRSPLNVPFPSDVTEFESRCPSCYSSCWSTNMNWDGREGCDVSWWRKCVEEGEGIEEIWRDWFETVWFEWMATMNCVNEMKGKEMKRDWEWLCEWGRGVLKDHWITSVWELSCLWNPLFRLWMEWNGIGLIDCVKTPSILSNCWMFLLGFEALCCCWNTLWFQWTTIDLNGGMMDLQVCEMFKVEQSRIIHICDGVVLQMNVELNRWMSFWNEWNVEQTMIPGSSKQKEFHSPMFQFGNAWVFKRLNGNEQDGMMIDKQFFQFIDVLKCITLDCWNTAVSQKPSEMEFKWARREKEQKHLQYCRCFQKSMTPKEWGG